MKRTFFLAFLLLIITSFIILTFGCGSSGGESGSNIPNDNDSVNNTENIVGNTENIVISGSFNQSVTFIERIYNFIFNKAYALDINEIRKVVIVTPTEKQVYDIIDGSFAIEISKDTKEPCVLIFTDISGLKKGYLTLGDGLDSLPLNLLSDGTRNIDLGVLNTDIESFTPSSNPILNGVFNVSSDQKEILSHMDDFLTALALSSDMDNNNVVDIIEGKNDIIFFHPMYQFNGGIINADWSLNSSTLTNNLSKMLRIYIRRDLINSLFTLTDPNGTIVNEPSIQDNEENVSLDFNVDLIEGRYTLTISGNEYSFVLPDQSNFMNSLHIPYFNLTSDINSITKVKWRFLDQEENDDTVNISNLVNDICMSNGQDPVFEANNGITELNTSIDKSRNRFNFWYYDIYHTLYQTGFESN